MCLLVFPSISILGERHLSLEDLFSLYLEKIQTKTQERVSDEEGREKLCASESVPEAFSF